MYVVGQMLPQHKTPVSLLMPAAVGFGVKGKERGVATSKRLSLPARGIKFYSVNVTALIGIQHVEFSCERATM